MVGADSHTCSAGGVGAWAAGLGAADVVMPMVTGETWLKVPETCKVVYILVPSIMYNICSLYLLGCLAHVLFEYYGGSFYTGLLVVT